MANTFKPWEKVKRNSELINYEGFRDDNGNKAILFESAAEMIECCKSNINNGVWNKMYYATNPNEVNHWKFGKDYPNLKLTDEALETGSMTEKYLTRIENVKEQLYRDVPRLKELSEIATTKRRRRTYKEDGAELDIDRYMCGDPAMWASMPRIDVKSRTAKIYMNTNVLAQVSASEIIENVIKMSAICEIMVASGVSVEIWAGTSAVNVHRIGAWTMIACKAKAANEPLDISRLLTFALPGFFRNYMFSLRVNTVGKDENLQEDMGSSPCSVEDLNDCCTFLEADVKMNGKTFESKETIDVVVNQIEKFFKLNSNETSNGTNDSW